MNLIGSLGMVKSTNLGNIIFDGEKVAKGYLRLEHDEVVEVCHGDASAGGMKGLVLPGFVNAHTHIGDSFGYPAPRISLERLVTPPDGYKHRALTAATRQTKEAGMLQSLQTMSASGTTVFSDFREEGVKGVEMLRGILRPDHPRAVILARPFEEPTSQTEIEALLGSSDGIGMSSVADCPMDLLKLLSKSTRSRERLFSIHMSEAAREDVDSVLSLHPDFVIHATKATQSDLSALAYAKTPVVVCARSNEFFGNKVNIPGMISAGVRVGLGTDNGMICRPDMIEEMKAAFRISAAAGNITALDIVKAATVEGRKILKVDGNTTPAPQRGGDFTVVKVPGRDPLEELVTIVDSSDVLATVRGGKVRRPASWR